MYPQQATVGLLALLSSPAAAYVLPAAHGCQSAARRTSTISCVEPITVAAFAAGLVPSSIALAVKENELQGARSEAELAKEELRKLSEGWRALITALELEVDEAEEKVDEIIAAGAKAAKKRKGELKELREQYEEKIARLKDLVGDQNDRLELQQNTFIRMSEITESAKLESLALKERARVLEERLSKATEKLSTADKSTIGGLFGFGRR